MTAAIGSVGIQTQRLILHSKKKPSGKRKKGIKKQLTPVKNLPVAAEKARLNNGKTNDQLQTIANRDPKQGNDQQRAQVYAAREILTDRNIDWKTGRSLTTTA